LVGVGLFAVTAFAQEPAKTSSRNVAQRVKATSDEDWEIQIVPGQAIGHPPLPRIELAKRTYAEVYNSIPFSRTEYLANQDYRHEATLEILFGQLRPKTVVRSAAPLGTSRTSYSQQSLGRPGGISPYLFWPPMFPASIGYWQP
jgi:hypothetical protein